MREVRTLKNWVFALRQHQRGRLLIKVQMGGITLGTDGDNVSYYSTS